MNLRILLVNTRHFLGGGDSTYTFNLAEVLRAQGHEVAFFAMHDPKNQADPNSDLFVSYIDFRKLNESKSISNGVKVLRRVVYSSEARYKFHLLLDRFRPHLVHLQGIHGHITPSVILETKARGLPVLWTLHDYKLVCPNTHFLIDRTGEICEACGKGRYYQSILKRCKKGSLRASIVASLEAYAHSVLRIRDKVDLFLTPSNFLRDKLIDRGFSPEKVHHLPVFLPSQSITDDYPISENCKYFLFLGKIGYLKGINVLLEACKMVPDIKLVIAGRVEDTFKNSFLLPSNVQYIGMKYGNELQELVRDALSIVLPSIWYENQPSSILEAFTFYKPVIASKLGGMSELVAHGERGLLVPPGDAYALAQAMSWMVENFNAVKQMGINARAYAQEYHGSELHYQRLMEFYKYVLEKRF